MHTSRQKEDLSSDYCHLGLSARKVTTLPEERKGQGQRLPIAYTVSYKRAPVVHELGGCCQWPVARCPRIALHSETLNTASNSQRIQEQGSGPEGASCSGES